MGLMSVSRPFKTFFCALASLSAFSLIAACGTDSNNQVLKLQSEDTQNPTRIEASRGVFVSHYELNRVLEGGARRIASELAAANITTAFVNIYPLAIPVWNSQAFRKAGGRGRHLVSVRAAIREFQRRGIRVVGWLEYGLALDSASHGIARKNPDWLQRRRNGSATSNENGKVFLSPTHGGVRNFIAQLAAEAAAELGLSEIALDRMRWTRAGRYGREFGYERSTSESYRARYGVNPPQNYDDPTWVRFREEALNGLMDEVSRRIRAARPGITVSATPVGHYGIAQHMQRWSTWLQRRLVDRVYIQAYADSASGFRQQARLLYQEAASVGRQGSVGFILKASNLNDSARVRADVRESRSLGIRNLSLWAYKRQGNKNVIEDNFGDF